MKVLPDVDVLKKQEQVFNEKRRRLQELYDLKPGLKNWVSKNFPLGRVSDGGSASFIAVDSAYASRTDALRRVEYVVVGVASWFARSDVLTFYESDEGVFFYEDDSRVEDALLSALGTASELKLLSKHSDQFRWAFLDGSLIFSHLVHLKAGQTVALRAKERLGIVRSVLEENASCVEVLKNVLRQGNLVAVPKKSRKNEFRDHVASRWKNWKNVTLYNDYELFNVILEEGEHVELTNLVDRKEVDDILLNLHSLGLNLDDETKRKLRNFKLFYVKGRDGIVHRVEFYGASEYFPADVVYSQSVTNTSQLAFIAEADEQAKKYLKLFFPEKVLFDKFR